jgi:hypothetical protein
MRDHRPAFLLSHTHRPAVPYIGGDDRTMAVCPIVRPGTVGRWRDGHFSSCQLIPWPDP